MARILIDGFESGGFGPWEQVGSAVAISGSYKYTGNYGAYYQNSSLAYTKKNLNNLDTIYFALKYNGVTGNRKFLSMGEATINHLNLSLTDAGGKAYVRAYRLTTYLADSQPYYLNYGTWYLVEGWFYIHDTSGRVVMKFNGITVIDFTGDTRNAGTGLATLFTIGYDSLVAGALQGYVDDIVLDDANWIGDTRIYGLAPDGAGATTQWSPSAGSNYACVDEVPESDADYVSVNSNDQIDTYSLANLGVSPYSIKCVQAQARAQKEGASTPQNIAMVLRQGGTDYPGSDSALETAFRAHGGLWETDPDTASAWTESGVNSLEAGIKSRA